MHIFSTVPISFAQAALGGDVKIQTVDGAVIYNVKPGTKTDTKVRLKGKGVPSLRNSAVRGDHYVTLVIQTPEKLSAEAKEALRRFDELSGNSLHQNDSNPEKSEKKTKRKGFMETATPAPAVKSQESANHPFHIIVAGGISLKDAEVIANQLKSKGFADAKALNTDGKVRVSISSFNNRDEATKQLLELRKNETYKNAWLLAK